MNTGASAVPAARATTGNAVVRWAADRSLRTKIAAAVGLMALVAVLVGAAAVQQMAAMNSAAENLYTNGLLPVRRIDEVQIDMERTRRDVLNHALSETDAGRTKYEQALQADDTAFTSDLGAYAADTDAPQLVADLRAAWQQYQQVRDQQVIPASRRGDIATVSRLRDEQLAPLANKANGIAANIITAETADGRHRRDTATSDFHAARTFIVAALVVGLLVALAFGMLVAQAIVAGLRRVSHAVEGLAACDLTRASGLDSRDEFGRMGQALDSAIGSVRGTVTELVHTATALSSASRDLSRVSGSLTDGASDASAKAGSAADAADEVNGSVQAVAAGAEQMNASIGEIAGSAARAAQVARDSLQVAQTASRQLDELGQAGSQIGEVVKLITSIAAQTNLLALNATIEAARAGDAGKGFAVVASEVKDLAQETAKATEQITARISAIQAGTANAAAAIAHISEVIDLVTEYTTTIASAVEEQSATTADMSRSIGDAATSSARVSQTFGAVASVATATAVSARASRTAADDLSSLAGKLNETVAVFRY